MSDFRPLWGGGHPNSAKGKFRTKTGISGPKTLVSAFFYYFFCRLKKKDLLFICLFNLNYVKWTLLKRRLCVILS